jgi:hypothetical protein
MPPADTQQQRAGPPLLPGLLWAGVGLAPVAALLVLFGGDNTGIMRVAVLLAIVAVVLIGVSMAFRRDPDAMRTQVEDMVFEELDVLREDLREDITTAARATHKSLGARVVTLQESVDALRGQCDTLRVQLERGAAVRPPAPQPVPMPRPAPPPPMSPVSQVPGLTAPHSMVRTETVKVTTRQTIVDQNDAGRGTVYGSSRGADPAPSQRRPPVSARDGSADEGESWTEQLLRQRLGDDRLLAAGLGDSGAGAGDRSRTFGDGGRVVGNGRGRSETGDRFGVDDRLGTDGRAGAAPVDEPYRGGGRRRAVDPTEDDGDRVTGFRTSDRWASLSSDERGRELRMGERRTAMQSDVSGTDVRIEDRWAAVRREEARREPERSRDRDPGPNRGRDGAREDVWGREPQRDRETGRPADPGRDRVTDLDERRGAGRGAASWAEARYDEMRADEPGRWRESSQPRPALPAAASEPSAWSWMEGWDAPAEPPGERVRRSAPQPDEPAQVYRWSRRDDDAGGYPRDDDAGGYPRDDDAGGYPGDGDERYRRSGGRDDRAQDDPPPRSLRARPAGYDAGYGTADERWRQ